MWLDVEHHKKVPEQGPLKQKTQEKAPAHAFTSRTSWARVLLIDEDEEQEYEEEGDIRVQDERLAYNVDPELVVLDNDDKI